MPTITSVTTTPYTATAQDDVIVSNLAGASTINLPSVAGLPVGHRIAVNNRGAGTATIDGAGSETINGATTLAVATLIDVQLISNGAAWFTVSKE